MQTCCKWSSGKYMGDIFLFCKYRWWNDVPWNQRHRDSFTVEGLSEKQVIKYQKDFWSIVNDRHKVSKNILLNHHVYPVVVEGKTILRIDVPAADRHDKPVYIGVDPMKGTYRRDYEGDFLCSEEAVRAMFADQRDGGTDTEVLDNMGLDALNTDTIKGYRIIFEQLHQGHPWNLLENDEFLMKLRAVAKNNKGELSPTIAGLLFFGEAYRITEVFANYFLDYREESEAKSVRWLFRTHSDERRGVVVVKKGKEITISNPGTIRITKEEFYAGGNSDPRNPNILKMFGFVNVGERAGSGVDKIMTAWKEQNWKKPEFDFSVRADRVTLKLEVGQVVYIPGAADLRVEEQKTSLLSEKEEAILHYIFERGSISTGKAAEVCGYKSRTSARKVIDEMVEKGYIVKNGKGASVRYSICGEKVVKKWSFTGQYRTLLSGVVG